jgi:uncharacterized protein YeaO (DUF488 family)
MLRTKSVHSPIEPKMDGLRILVARLRGHGLTKERYDVWMANLGSSEKLLRELQNGKVSWTEFRRRYRDALFEGGTIDSRNRTIKNHGQRFTLRLLQHLAQSQTVTLLCHCAENEEYCHRHLLKAILEAKV